jgi:predicted nucleic acid-binding protein
VHLGAFFNRPRSSAKQAIDQLLDEDRAALIGPILTEILLGFRHDNQADWVSSVLGGLHYLEPTWNEWRMAARLGRSLKARGHTLPLSDLVLGAVAIERKLAVYASDPDFDLLTVQRLVA